MNLLQIQVNVDDLMKGMYVCKLDRPWIETPFPFQGFYVSSGDDIRTLRKYCNTVFIDVERGYAPQIKSRVVASNIGSAPNKARNAKVPRPAKISIKHDEYGKPSRFSGEIRRAEKHYDDLQSAVAQSFDDIKVGRPLSLTAARAAAAQMVRSVIRNPDAFVWLSRLGTHHAGSYHHSIRSAIWGIFFARHLGLEESKLLDLAMACLLADIGKCKISTDLLEKSEPLSERERERVRAHVGHSIEILDQSAGINDRILSIVATHHERYDGGGYPNNLMGDQIPLLGRIAGLVDSYDAMTSPRPYADTMTPGQAMDHLFELRDVEFQAQLVDEFIQAVGIFPSGSVVELNSKEVGVILSHQFATRLRPKIALVLNKHQELYDRIRVIDLAKNPTNRQGEPIRIDRSIAATDYDVDFVGIHARHVAKRWNIGSILNSIRPNR